MVTFQRKYDALSVVLVSDGQYDYGTTEYENFPVIVSSLAVSFFIYFV